MGLFNARQPAPPPPPRPTDALPIAPVDLNKRYDVYCTDHNHDRLYENVRFLGIRTFDRISEFSSGLVGGFLEIEAADGARWLIPSFGIRLICEHGTQPAYKVLRHPRNRRAW